MTAIRALIVDDEALARRRLKRLLLSAPDVIVVGEAASGLAAVDLVAELEPDLLFLDVQLPELDGFGILTAIESSRPPLVVFTTAYSEHAVSAFDTRALDYLVKPIQPARFQMAIGRAREALARRDKTDVSTALASFSRTGSRRPGMSIGWRCAIAGAFS
jgi:two-component system LytT family response regulator